MKVKIEMELSDLKTWGYTSATPLEDLRIDLTDVLEHDFPVVEGTIHIQIEEDE